MKISKEDWLSLRPGWTPLPVLLTLIGFLVYWPLGLAGLAYILIGGRFRRRKGEGAIEPPLGDWPEMQVHVDQGVVRLAGTYTAPSAWWSQGFPALLLVFGGPLMIGSCAMFANEGYGGLKNVPTADLLYFIGAFIGGGILIAVVAEHFGRRRALDVSVSPEAIAINGKSYAMHQGLNQFAKEEHERAFRDRRQGNRIYVDAMQVVMRYGERRVAIADFRAEDERKADALLVRLQTLAEPKALEQLLSVAGPVEEGEAAGPGEQDDFGPARPIR